MLILRQVLKSILPCFEADSEAVAVCFKNERFRDTLLKLVTAEKSPYAQLTKAG